MGGVTCLRLVAHVRLLHNCKQVNVNILHHNASWSRAPRCKALRDVVNQALVGGLVSLFRISGTPDMGILPANFANRTAKVVSKLLSDHCSYL